MKDEIVEQICKMFFYNYRTRSIITHQPSESDQKITISSDEKVFSIVVKELKN